MIKSTGKKAACIYRKMAGVLLSCSSAIAVFLLTVALLQSASPANAASLSMYDDIHMGFWDPNRTRWEGSTYLCLSEVTGRSIFRISVTGQNDARRFYNLANDIGDPVAYRVYLYFGNRLKRRERLLPGRASRRTFGGEVSRGCPGGPTMRVFISVNKRLLDRAPTGIYQDSLLFMLSPL